MYLFFIEIIVLFRCSSSHPNIVFILADDLGWNDVSWTNPDVSTPNLASLRSSGVRLHQYYTQPICSPSRAAILTGIYPHRIGMTENLAFGLTPFCLDAKLRLLPQVLRSHYSTHLVGKWHLGFCDWRCTPTQRGFDTFYGHYDAFNHHYTHTHTDPWYPGNNVTNGVDFRDNEDIVLDQNGTYSAHAHTNRAIEIIHTAKRPFFIDLSYDLPHFPLEVPTIYRQPYTKLNLSSDRQTYLSMVSALDSYVGQVVRALKDVGQFDNTILVFASDNGGEVRFGGDNYPLRGQKYGIFEGGTRVPAFVVGPGLTSRDYHKLFHVVDWFVTLLTAVGLYEPKHGSLDSLDHWACFNKLPGLICREEFVYNLRSDSAGIRVGRYKLIVGDPEPMFKSHVRSTVNNSLTYTNTSIPYNTLHYSQNLYLFDLEKDSEERFNLAPTESTIVKELTSRLQRYMKDKYVTNGDFQLIGDGDPKYWGGVWSPGWCVIPE